MAITKIKVDGVAVSNLTTPVKVKLRGSGKHHIEYISDSNTIKSEAFKNCDILTLTIPEEITKINGDAFKDSKLEAITFKGEEPPLMIENTIPTDTDVIVKAEYLDKWTDFNADSVKDNVFHSEIEVGDVLYERATGETYIHKYDPEIVDTPLGVCVIPKGLFNEHAHFIGLRDIDYNPDGTVMELLNKNDYNEHFLYWAPYVSGYFYSPSITCYSLLPYIGILTREGEIEEGVKYYNYEDVPDITKTNLPTANISYTNAIEFKMQEGLGQMDWSDKSRAKFCKCVYEGNSGSGFSMPGGVELRNPYDKSTHYMSDTVMPVEYLGEERKYWMFSRYNYLPSPYTLKKDNDEVTGNPDLTRDLGKSSLVNDLGNPFRFYGSANEFLLPLLQQCVKPTDEHDLHYGTTGGNGVSINGVQGNKVTFFAAPYCAYEYAPGTGNTKNQWALGTPLEWICFSARLDKINSTIEQVGGMPINTSFNGPGFYWGGLMANDGLVYVFSSGSNNLNMITTANPRFSTRPFIII